VDFYFPMKFMTPDFSSETFRLLKEKEKKQYGEYRTRRLKGKPLHQAFTKILVYGSSCLVSGQEAEKL
jgi:hypothetical protein